MITMPNNYPKIEPIKLKEYTSKQSTYPHCAKLPMRSIVLGPSGSGKTIITEHDTRHIRKLF